MMELKTNAPRILRRPVVQEAIGLGRSSLYVLVAKGEFPAPVQLSQRAVGWLESDVNEWIASRKSTGGLK